MGRGAFRWHCGCPRGPLRARWPRHRGPYLDAALTAARAGPPRSSARPVSCPQRGYSRSLKENSAASYFFWNGPWLQNENAPCAGQHQLPKSQSHSRDLRTAMSPGRGSSAKLATPSPALSWATGPPGTGNGGPARPQSPCLGLDVRRHHWCCPLQQARGDAGAGPACCAPGEGLSVNGRKFP